MVLVKNYSNTYYTIENFSEEIDLKNNSENYSCRDDLSENISEDMEHNNNNETNDSNREDLSENVSSQKTQYSRKSVLNT